MLLDVLGVDGGHAREAHQPPTRLVAIPAVDRVGEEALLGVLPQQGEERARRGGGQAQRAFVQGLQDVLLLRGLEGGEPLAVETQAALVGLGYGRAIDLPRREPRLVALLRSAFRPGARAILAGHRAELARQLPIDEDRHPGFLRAGAELVLGNEPRERGLEKRDLGCREVGVRLRRGQG